MKKKTVLITVSIILLLTTLAWAFWPAIALRAGLRIATSQGARRVVVQAGISQAAARGAGRLALVQNKTDLAWKVVSTTAALLGISYLVSDIGGLKNKMESEIPVDPTTKKFTIITPVEKYEVRVSGGGKLTDSTYLKNNIKLKTKSTGYTVHWGTLDQSVYPKGTNYVETKEYSNGNYVPGWDSWCVPGFGINHINEYESPVTPVETAERTETAIYQWIDNNPEAWLDPSLVTNTLTDTAPSGAQDMGETSDVTITDEYEPDPSTGAKQDPQTGLDQTPVKNPDDETDTFNAPSQPSLPIFDPTMDIPDKMSIPDKITYFLNNAPFMNVINNFQVNASSGSSSLTFTVWGRNYQWDFARYEDFYNMMAAVLLSLAYIWSAQIVFGGRA